MIVLFFQFIFLLYFSSSLSHSLSLPQPFTHSFLLLCCSRLDIDSPLSSRRYAVKKRLITLYFGSMALVDALMLPFLLPLWVTWYRYAPVRQELSQANQWGLHEFAVLLTQFSFLFLDLLFSPLFFLLFVTRIRWKVVRARMAEDDLRSNKSFVVYAALLEQAGYLLLDFTLMPCLILLLITHYRLKPILKALQDAETEQTTRGLGEFCLVWKQFSLLVLDALFLPLYAVLFCTRIRWRPVEEKMRADNLTTLCPNEVYGMALLCGLLLTLDVVLFPFLLLILITGYRSKPIRGIWNSPQEWHTCRIHIAIVGNALYIVHDAFLLVLMSITIVIVPYRVKRIVSIAREHLDRYFAQRASSTSANAITATDATNIQDPAPTLTITEPVVIWPKWLWRLAFWVEFAGMLIDIPFFPLALVVLVTVWRASLMCKGISKALRNSTQSEINIADCSAEMKARLEILQQFLLLLRDAIFLVPLFVIVGTLVRLPGVLLAIAARMSSKPLEGRAALQIVEAVVEFPDRGGPTFKLRVQVAGDSDGTGADDIVDDNSGGQAESKSSGPDSSKIAATTSRDSESFYSPLADVSRQPPAASDDSKGNSKGQDKEEGEGENVLPVRPIANAHMVAALPGPRRNKPALIVDVTRPAKLYLQGPPLWAQVETIWGSTAVSLASSFLPLKLDSSQITVARLNEALLTDEPSAPLEMRIDAGSVKKTTMLKNLRKLRGDTVFVIQVEANTSTAPTPNATTAPIVLPPIPRPLLRFCPTARELDECMVSGSGTLSNDALDRNGIRYATAMSQGQQGGGDDDKNGVVNSFYIIVGMAFVQLLLDLAHIVLALITLCVPWRGIEMLVGLFEPASHGPWRIAEWAEGKTGDAEGMLLEYRAEVAPLFNSLAKEILARNECKASKYSTYVPNIQYTTSRGTTEAYFKSFEKLDKLYLDPYRKISQRLITALETFGGCQRLVPLFIQRTRLHHALIHFWTLRFAANIRFGDDGFDPVTYDIVISSIAQSHDSVARKMFTNLQSIRHMINEMKMESAEEKKKKAACCGLGRMGLLNRPLDLSRQMIRLVASQALIDLGFILLMLLIVITLVRAVPLIRDLCANKTFSPNKYTTRKVLVRHTIQIIFLLTKILIFHFYPCTAAACHGRRQ